MEEMALQGALKLAAGLKLKRAQGAQLHSAWGGQGCIPQAHQPRAPSPRPPRRSRLSPAPMVYPGADQGVMPSFPRGRPHSQLPTPSAWRWGLPRPPGVPWGGFAGYVEALRGPRDPQELIHVPGHRGLEGHGLQGVENVGGVPAPLGLESQMSAEQARVLPQRHWQQQRHQNLLLLQQQQQQRQQLLLQQQQQQHQQQQQTAAAAATTSPEAALEATARQAAAASPGAAAAAPPGAHPRGPHGVPQGMQQGGQEAQEAFIVLGGGRTPSWTFLRCTRGAPPLRGMACQAHTLTVRVPVGGAMGTPRPLWQGQGRGGGPSERL